MYYGGVNAKVKAMKGRLLGFSDYYNISLSSNVSEAVNKLINYEDYREIIEYIISRQTVNRHALERHLNFVLDYDYKKIHGFVLDLGVKSYLKAFFQKREIHIIKQKLSSLYDVRNIDYGYDENSVNIKKYYKNIEAAFSAETIDSFIDGLKGSDFHGILKNIYNEGISLFDLEIALDFYYYNNLWKVKNKTLNSSDKEAVTIISGSEIDAVNIIWIFRLKNYYKLEGDRIYKYILPINYKLKPDIITKMAASRDSKELMEIISQTPYGYAFIDGQRIENAYYKILDNAHRRAAVRQPSSISTIIDYLFRKSIELENIITVFEGVRYSMASSEIMDRLRIINYCESLS